MGSMRWVLGDAQSPAPTSEIHAVGGVAARLGGPRRRRICWYVSSTIAGGWRDRLAPAAAAAGGSAAPTCSPLQQLGVAPHPSSATLYRRGPRPPSPAAAPARRRRQRLPSAPPPRQRPSPAPACAPARARVYPASGGQHCCPRPMYCCPSGAAQQAMGEVDLFPCQPDFLEPGTSRCALMTSPSRGDGGTRGGFD